MLVSRVAPRLVRTHSLWGGGERWGLKVAIVGPAASPELACFTPCAQKQRVEKRTGKCLSYLREQIAFKYFRHVVYM